VRLLFVCDRVPWPADGGPAVRIAGLLRSLAEAGHEVELAAFAAGPAAFSPPPAGVDVRVTAVASPGEGKAGDWLRDDGESALPWSVRQRASAEMAAAVQRLSAESDVVVAVSLAMTQYLDQVAAGVPRVYDALDVESLALEQTARIASSPLARLHAAREAAAMQRYERSLGERADVVTAVTDVDADRLRLLAPGIPVHTVPIGVVVDDYAPLWQQASPRIAFFGDLGWPPNVDAAVHLCRDVLPLLDEPPPVVLAGRRPAPEVQALAAPEVEVTGAVPRMDAVLAGDTIAVAPLRAGTGMRVKLLESMAWCLPTVSSALGCAGIDHGGALVEADGAEPTAAALATLLADAGRRGELGLAGRALVAERYGYERSGAALLTALGVASRR
jgi:glycosyltransferase involved in cell wall biosynthesis